MSRIDFAPAQTTATRVRDSSTRSAEMSNVSSAPRWTPPMPPVAKISMPGELGDEHRRGDRRAGRAAPGDDRREIAPRGLDHAAGELAKAARSPARRGRPGSVRRRRRSSPASRPNERTASSTDARRLDVARIGHAVGDDRRFERDDRLFRRRAPRRPRGKIPEDRRRSSLDTFIAGRRDRRQTRFIGNPRSGSMARPSASPISLNHEAGRC